MGLLLIRRIQQSYLGDSVYININTSWLERIGWDFCFSFQVWTQQGEKEWDVLIWPWAYTDTTPWLCNNCTQKGSLKDFCLCFPSLKLRLILLPGSILKSHPSDSWAGCEEEVGLETSWGPSPPGPPCASMAPLRLKTDWLFFLIGKNCTPQQ